MLVFSKKSRWEEHPKGAHNKVNSVHTGNYTIMALRIETAHCKTRGAASPLGVTFPVLSYALYVSYKGTLTFVARAIMQAHANQRGAPMLTPVRAKVAK